MARQTNIHTVCLTLLYVHYVIVLVHVKTKIQKQVGQVLGYKLIASCESKLVLVFTIFQWW